MMLRYTVCAGADMHAARLRLHAQQHRVGAGMAGFSVPGCAIGNGDSTKLV